RFVVELARALPIEAAAERDARKVLRRAADGLLARRLPVLADFRTERGRDGRWLAVFERKEAPRQDQYAARVGPQLTPGETLQVGRITEAVGGEDDRLWWTQCVRRLGAGPVDRALGLLKE